MYMIQKLDKSSAMLITGFQHKTLKMLFETLESKTDYFKKYTSSETGEI